MVDGVMVDGTMAGMVPCHYFIILLSDCFENVSTTNNCA